VLATRHDMRVGLHRLRLEGELTEFRVADLRFTRDEARALLEAAGVELPERALAMLHERTEGWAAGLRLAALSLAGHPDPERFAAQFPAASGRWRSTCWPRCWNGRARRCGGCCRRPPCWTGSAACSPMPSPEVARAAGEMVRGSAEEAGRQLALAASALASVPADRRERVRVLLAVLRVLLARRRMDVPVVVEEAQRLLAPAVAADAARLGLGEPVRAAALISLIIAEIWALRFEDAERHLEQPVSWRGR
jgi:hypothetical protein